MALCPTSRAITCMHKNQIQSINHTINHNHNHNTTRHNGIQ